MKKVSYIVLHCSDSRFGSERMISRWHKEKGWRDIGYHFVILNGQITNSFYLDALDGSIELGRSLDEDNFIEPDEVGAHALGYNDKSIGICMIGISNFTKRQFDSLVDLIIDLMDQYGIDIDHVIGHYETELSHGKTCPNIDMDLVRSLVRDKKSMVDDYIY